MNDPEGIQGQLFPFWHLVKNTASKTFSVLMPEHYCNCCSTASSAHSGKLTILYSPPIQCQARVQYDLLNTVQCRKDAQRVGLYRMEDGLPEFYCADHYFLAVTH